MEFARLRLAYFAPAMPQQRKPKMRTYALAITLAISAVLSAGLASGPVHAQGGAKNTCPGGISACIDRCVKAGGQPRNCPTYCQRQKGC
jgi:hypothetical protein